MDHAREARAVAGADLAQRELDRSVGGQIARDDLEGAVTGLEIEADDR
jgi:hypothetical protein